VLGNLIDNAFRHSPKGRTVTAGARDGKGGFVEVYVSDQGEGVAREDLPHLFDRFYRSKNESAGGAGLGLAISREIVRAHGGEIHAESSASGGTTFTFTLPASSKPAGAKGSAPQGKRGADTATSIPATDA
jgi:signal transduction histidine kinase